MKKVVISPHARNAPMLGITIPARNPPNRWTLARHPPVAPMGTGIAVAIVLPLSGSASSLRALASRAPTTAPMAVRRITPSREHDLDARTLESTAVGIREPGIADQHVEFIDRREPHGCLLVELRVVREDH